MKWWVSFVVDAVVVVVGGFGVIGDGADVDYETRLAFGLSCGVADALEIDLA